MNLDVQSIPLSWSDLVRPSTSFNGQHPIVASKLVDGRAKHDHDGEYFVGAPIEEVYP
jgi:hypothetical protein